MSVSFAKVLWLGYTQFDSKEKWLGYDGKRPSAGDVEKPGSKCDRVPIRMKRGSAFFFIKGIICLPAAALVGSYSFWIAHLSAAWKNKLNYWKGKKSPAGGATNTRDKNN